MVDFLVRGLFKVMKIVRMLEDKFVLFLIDIDCFFGVFKLESFFLFK